MAPWVLLPLIACESVGGNGKQAIPLCAALQFFIAAGDVFDDVEDDDSPLALSVKYGTAITNNIATTLLVLGEKAIASLKIKGVSDSKTIKIADTVNSYYLTACFGQHKDLSCSGKIDITEEEYLEILSQKSASQIECACHAGVLLATENTDLLDPLKEFGYNLGMMAQITNDISGIIYQKDILNREITFPVIFALSQAESPIRDELKKYYQNQTDNKLTAEQVSKILFDTGAMHYSLIIKESYRTLAANAVEKAEKYGADPKRLREFLK
ncbi:MAG: polyprenyl synthetase family protein [Dehalococcoidales bacterium]